MYYLQKRDYVDHTDIFKFTTYRSLRSVVPSQTEFKVFKMRLVVRGNFKYVHFNVIVSHFERNSDSPVMNNYSELTNPQ